MDGTGSLRVVFGDGYGVDWSGWSARRSEADVCHFVLELLLLLELLELLKVELLLVLLLQLLLLLAKEESIMCSIQIDHALSVTNCWSRERG